MLKQTNCLLRVKSKPIIAPISIAMDSDYPNSVILYDTEYLGNGYKSLFHYGNTKSNFENDKNSNVCFNFYIGIYFFTVPLCLFYGTKPATLFPNHCNS